MYNNSHSECYTSIASGLLLSANTKLWQGNVFNHVCLSTGGVCIWKEGVCIQREGGSAFLGRGILPLEGEDGGDLHLGGGDTMGYGQHAGGTHPTGMHSSLSC